MRRTGAGTAPQRYQTAVYVLEYSLYKTLAGKLRTSVGRVKARFTRDGVLGVEYATKGGPRRITLFTGGFHRVAVPLFGAVDALPDPRASRSGARKGFAAFLPASVNSVASGRTT